MRVAGGGAADAGSGASTNRMSPATTATVIFRARRDMQTLRKPPAAVPASLPCVTNRVVECCRRIPLLSVGGGPVASFDELARRFTTLEPSPLGHLRRLVASWGLLADFCFADLLLFVPITGGEGTRF